MKTSLIVLGLIVPLAGCGMAPKGGAPIGNPSDLPSPQAKVPDRVSQPKIIMPLDSRKLPARADVEYLKPTWRSDADSRMFFRESVDKTRAKSIVRYIDDGDIDALKAMLKSGADPNEIDSRGYTALWHAAFGESPRCDMINVLLDAGSNGEVINYAKANAIPPFELEFAPRYVSDGNGWFTLKQKEAHEHVTLLDVAATEGRADSLRCLLGRERDDGARERLAKTSLELAADHDQIDFIKDLLRTYPQFSRACLVKVGKDENSPERTIRLLHYLTAEREDAVSESMAYLFAPQLQHLDVSSLMGPLANKWDALYELNPGQYNITVALNMPYGESEVPSDGVTEAYLWVYTLHGEPRTISFYAEPGKVYYLRSTVSITLYLTETDIRSVRNLAAGLKRQADPLTQFLYSSLSAPTRALLDASTNSPMSIAPLQSALLTDLNQIIIGESIFDEQRFSSVHLSERTRKLLDGMAVTDMAVRLNRYLLEDAFPADIVKSETHPVSLRQFSRLARIDVSTVISDMVGSYDAVWAEFEEHP